MPYVIGTDEAGYGPNLGPLVVGATLWRIPQGSECNEQTWHKLRPELTDTVANDTPNESLLIADSKNVYKPGGGLRGLELPVLSMWQSILPGPLDRETLWQSLSPGFADQLRDEVWWDHVSSPWPHDTSEPEVRSWTERIENRFEATGIRCFGMRSAVIAPNQFNALIDSTGNKANLLTQITLSLIAQLTNGLDDEEVWVLCDRHGGRTKYRSALQHAFPDSLIQVLDERPNESVYSWGRSPGRVECRFMTGGERNLPVALASMIAKYLRELAMSSFNSFWQSEVPGLKPTAGYPVDAKRFRVDIETARTRLGIGLNHLWRCR